MYDGTGYKPVVPYTGHGVGLKVHEPPYLSQVDRTVLEPGMVVTGEPTVQFSGDGDIFISLEDQFLITEDGAEYCDSRRVSGFVSLGRTLNSERIPSWQWIRKTPHALAAPLREVRSQHLLWEPLELPARARALSRRVALTFCSSLQTTWGNSAGCYGDSVARTPNIDRLALRRRPVRKRLCDGRVFAALLGPACSPGLFPQQHGLLGMAPVGLPGPQRRPASAQSSKKGRVSDGDHR